MRRPPSLSEGCIRIDQLFDKKQPFILNHKSSIQDTQESALITLRTVEAVEAAEEEVSVKAVGSVERHSYEVITDYSLRFLLHLTLISFFETLFFFKFVSQDEDKGILQITNYYTQKIISGCSNLSDQEIFYLNIILNKLVNATTMKQDGVGYLKYRSDANGALYTTSWIYFSGIAGLFVVVSGVSLLLRFKIHWAHIFCENFVFVSLLGVYELMFFLNIIKKYITTSPQEISLGLIDGLEQSCKLLI